MEQSVHRTPSSPFEGPITMGRRPDHLKTLLGLRTEISGGLSRDLLRSPLTPDPSQNVEEKVKGRRGGGRRPVLTFQLEPNINYRRQEKTTTTI